MLDGEALSRRGDVPEAPPLAGERGPAPRDLPPGDPDPAALRCRPRPLGNGSARPRGRRPRPGSTTSRPPRRAHSSSVVADDLGLAPRPRRGGSRSPRRRSAEAEAPPLHGRAAGAGAAGPPGGDVRETARRPLRASVLWLIFLVLGLLAVETDLRSARERHAGLPRRRHAGLPRVPLGLLLPPRPGEGEVRWFLRHCARRLLPSIPVGLLAWQPIRAGRAPALPPARARRALRPRAHAGHPDGAGDRLPHARRRSRRSALRAPPEPRRHPLPDARGEGARPGRGARTRCRACVASRRRSTTSGRTCFAPRTGRSATEVASARLVGSGARPAAERPHAATARSRSRAWPPSGRFRPRCCSAGSRRATAEGDRGGSRRRTSSPGPRGPCGCSPGRRCAGFRSSAPGSRASGPR